MKNKKRFGYFSNMEGIVEYKKKKTRRSLCNLYLRKKK